MTDSMFLTLIAAIPPTLMSLAAFINSLRNGRQIVSNGQRIDQASAQARSADENTREIAASAYAAITSVRADIEGLHIIVNDRLSQLLAKTASESHAAGFIEGAGLVLPPGPPPPTPGPGATPPPDTSHHEKKP
jgi:hypothetical protein